MSTPGVLIVWIAKVLNMALTVYFWVIFARALFSWIRPNPYNPIVRIVVRLVDPVTNRIRRILPTRFGMIDIAPFFLMLIIIFLQEAVTRLLLHLALTL